MPKVAWDSMKLEICVEFLFVLMFLAFKWNNKMFQHWRIVSSSDEVFQEKISAWSKWCIRFPSEFGFVTWKNQSCGPCDEIYLISYLVLTSIICRSFSVPCKYPGLHHISCHRLLVWRPTPSNGARILSLGHKLCTYTVDIRFCSWEGVLKQW